VEYLLDTDTCIDLLCGLRPVVSKLEMLSPEDCGISAITTFELFAGAAKSRQPSNEIDKIERLVSVLEEISFDREAARQAGALRYQLHKAGTPLGPYDLLIAAHALALDLTLVTANTVEFGRVAGLRIESWR
jgi:tRNA(fMet)-specific endonuclease VapC